MISWASHVSHAKLTLCEAHPESWLIFAARAPGSWKTLTHGIALSTFAETLDSHQAGVQLEVCSKNEQRWTRLTSAAQKNE